MTWALAALGFLVWSSIGFLLADTYYLGWSHARRVLGGALLGPFFWLVAWRKGRTLKKTKYHQPSCWSL